VVVSEETGTISLVAGGRIRREYDGPGLKAALLEAMEIEETPVEDSSAPQAAPARDE
jgi:hypothetical protein